MRIINQCQSNFKYTLPVNGLLFTKSIQSNEVLTTIVPSILKITKEVSTSCSTVFELLTYRITIENTSTDVAKHLVFSDKLSPYLKFVKNSFIYNGKILFCLAPTDAYYIGNLEPGEKAYLSFKVIVLPGATESTLTNSASVYFDYIYNIELDPTVITFTSNPVSTSITHDLFKEFNLSHRLPMQITPPFTCLKSLRACIQITTTKVIASPVNAFARFPSSQLIIIGRVFYTLVQSNGCPNEVLKCVEIIEGFSTFLAVPWSIQLTDTYSPTLTIKSLNYQKVKPSHLLIDATVLLEIK